MVSMCRQFLAPDFFLFLTVGSSQARHLRLAAVVAARLSTTAWFSLTNHEQTIQQVVLDTTTWLKLTNRKASMRQAVLNIAVRIKRTNREAEVVAQRRQQLAVGDELARNLRLKTKRYLEPGTGDTPASSKTKAIITG